ncbi:unnamed protein product, partial [Symbiodinium sp. CCMP2456]
VDVSQAAEFFGKLLFDDTAGWPLTDAGYSSNPSCIIELSLGPFNGELALSTPGKDKAKLLDRDTEMQDMVTKIVARAKRLKRCASSDKSLSPALLVAQAPGSGKSHFLAELGENISRLWDLDGNLQRPIVSVFTYNSAMGDKWTDVSRMSNSGVDLGLRVLFGAAHHMTSTGLRCKSWMAFLDAINQAVSSENMLQSLVDLNFVVKILRHWYGARPLLILADEVQKHPALMWKPSTKFAVPAWVDNPSNGNGKRIGFEQKIRALEKYLLMWWKPLTASGRSALSLNALDTEACHVFKTESTWLSVHLLQTVDSNGKHYYK